MQLYKGNDRYEFIVSVEPIFGLGWTFTPRGFNLVLGPVLVSLKVFTKKDIERHKRMMETVFGELNEEDSIYTEYKFG